MSAPQGWSHQVGETVNTGRPPAHARTGTTVSQEPQVPVDSGQGAGDNIFYRHGDAFFWHGQRVEPDPAYPWDEKARKRYARDHQLAEVPTTELHPEQVARLESQAAMVRAELKAQEEAARAEAARQAREREKLEQVLRRIDDLSHRKAGGTILFLSEVGGAGKSSCATNLAASIREDNGDTVGCLDLCYDRGGAAGRLGCPKTLTVEEFASHRDYFRADSRAFERFAKKHPRNRVMTVSSSPIEAADGSVKLDRVDIRDVIEIARSRVKWLVIDFVNGIMNVIAKEVIGHADVIVAMANSRKQDSLDKLWFLLSYLKQQVPEKFANTVVLVTGYAEGVVPAQEFDHYLNHLEQNEETEIYEVVDPTEKLQLPIYGLPHDPQIEKEKVDLPNLKPPTRQCLREFSADLMELMPDLQDPAAEMERFRLEGQKRADQRLQELKAELLPEVREQVQEELKKQGVVPASAGPQLVLAPAGSNNGWGGPSS